jgi:predicted TIM-barrel fold metal-dependent hydrolase
MPPMSDIRRVDCHVHYHPREVSAGLDAWFGPRFMPHIFARPAWRDLDALTSVMDETGVDLGYIIPTSGVVAGLRDMAGPTHEHSEAYNRSMSRDLGSTNGRFVATAIVDPFGGKEELAQLERSLKLPHIIGIGLTTNYGDVTLDDSLFEPIFDLARDYDAPVTVHPGGSWPGWQESLKLDTQFLMHGLGFFLVDAMCIFRMAGAGVFERYPTVRFMFCQLGGVAPICCSRWAFHGQQTAMRQEIREGKELMPHWAKLSLSELLSHVWLDTHTQDRHALALVMAEAGDHTIVLGGDYPYTLPNLGMEYTLAELDALGLEAGARGKIEGQNALALMGERAPKARLEPVAS